MDFDKRQQVIRSVDPDAPPAKLILICASTFCPKEVQPDHEYCEQCEKDIEERLEIEAFYQSDKEDLYQGPCF